MKLKLTAEPVSQDHSAMHQQSQNLIITQAPGLYLGSLMILMTEGTRSEDDSTSIKLPTMCALFMAAGEMYNLVIYSSSDPYFAAVERIKNTENQK